MVFSLVFFNGFWVGLGPILGGVWGPFGVPWITFGDAFDVCMSISLEKAFPTGWRIRTSRNLVGLFVSQ